MNIHINDDLTSNITTEDGMLECNLPAYNPETLLPFTSKEEVEAFANTIAANPNYFITKISDEEKAALLASNTLKQTIARAKQELAASDWSDLPSVRNEAIEPHLTNGAEFDAYRAALRGIVVSKPSAVAAWPVCPDASWSTT